MSGKRVIALALMPSGMLLVGAAIVASNSGTFYHHHFHSLAHVAMWFIVGAAGTLGPALGLALPETKVDRP